MQTLRFQMWGFPVWQRPRLHSIWNQISTGAWVRGLLEQLDPRGQRDAAIRSAAALLGPAAPSARAKQLAKELERYCSTVWLRERALPCPPPGVSGLRRELFYIARLTAGAGLSWRQLARIIEA